MSAELPDDLLDRLYGLPLDEFVAEREAAAKALRKEKRREEATAVGALRRPSVAAWLVNRLARDEREAVDELLAAGEALRAAQDEAVAGRGADELRAAGQREQEAVQALVRAARGLEPGGKAPSGDVVDRVQTTLHAAAGDEALRAEIDAGRLTREVEGGGAWPFMADASEPPDRPPRERTPRRKTKGSRKESADDDAAEADAEAERKAAAEREAADKERRRELAAAEKEHKARRRERERAERRAQAAEEKAAEAATAAEAAAAELDEARAAEDEAAARVAELED